MSGANSSYRKAFFIAIGLHCLIALFLLGESSNSRPVVVKENLNRDGQKLPIAVENKPAQEIVKAVAVNSEEVMKTVNRLKQEQMQAQQAEKARQQQLARQAEQAKQQRIIEQQRLAKLKQEAETLAIARKKQIEEEQKRIKELAVKKEQETKKLADLKKKQEDMKKKQAEEDKKIAELKKKQAEEKVKEAKRLQELVNKEKAEKDKIAKENAAKAAAMAAEAAARQKAAAQQQALAEAANQARIAGEVDKYKAMILDSIGRQWNIPDNANKSLSSQFRIRLAPDGEVLEVSLLRSSGDPILDRSAQTAIKKASPLPVPADPQTFNLFREISLTVRPENIRG